LPMKALEKFFEHSKFRLFFRWFKKNLTVRTVFRVYVLLYCPVYAQSSRTAEHTAGNEGTNEGTAGTPNTVVSTSSYCRVVKSEKICAN
jgi:hypothetical protein